MKQSDETFIRDLHQVPWQDYKSLSGEPKILPKVLEEVYLGKKAESALGKAFGVVFEQGDRSPATTAVIPFFGRLLPIVADSLKIVLLECLVLLGVGYEDQCVGKDGVTGSSYYEEEYFRAVEAQAPRFLTLLEHGETEVANAAARAISWFPSVAEQSIPVLRSRAKTDNEDQYVITTISLGLLKADVPLVTDKSSRVRYASNIAFCEGKGIVDELNLAIFLEMCDWRYNQTPHRPWGDWEIGFFNLSLGSYAAELLNRVGNEMLHKFLEAAKPSPFLSLVTTPQPWRGQQ